MKNWKNFLIGAGIPGLIIGLIIISNEPDKQIERLSVGQEILLAKVGDEIKLLRTEKMNVRKGEHGKLHANIFTVDKYYFDKEDSVYKEVDLSVHEISGFAKLNPTRKHDKFVNTGFLSDTWFDDRPHSHKVYDESGNYYVGYEALFDTTDVIVERKHTARMAKYDYIIAETAQISVLSWLVDTNTDSVFLRANRLCFYVDDKIIFTVPEMTAHDAEGNFIETIITYLNNELSVEAVIPADAVYPITVDPTTTVQATNDIGRVRIHATYTTARNFVTGDDAASIRVGQQFFSDDYYVYRVFLSFFIPSIPGTITAVSLFLEGKGYVLDTNFNIFIHTSTYIGDSGDFIRFDGHQASGTYNGTILNYTWSSSSYSDDWNEIVFLAAGLAVVQAAKNSTLKLAAISQEDYYNSSPTNGEFVYFESSAVDGKEPYLSITYTFVKGTSYTTEHSLSDFYTHQATNHATYASARGVAAYTSVTTTAVDSLGQIYNDLYDIWRVSFEVYDIPQMDVIEAGTLFINLTGDSSAPDFNIHVYTGEWEETDNEGTRFYRFDGWETGITPYTGSQWLEPWSTSSYSGAGELKLPLNDNGLLAVLNARQDTLRGLFISSRDFQPAAPSGNEYLALNDTDAKLKIVWSYSDITAPTTAPGLYYASGDVFDESGNENHGTNHGAWFEKDGYATGDHAYDFDGTDDYISVSDNDDLDMGTSDFTLIAKVKTGTLADDIYDIINKGGWGVQGYGLAIRFKKIALTIQDDNTSSAEYSDNVLSDNNWSSIAVSCDRDGNVTFYVNGSANGTGDISNEAGTVTNTKDIGIGALSGGASQWFPGYIDDIRIYDMLLSATAIDSIHNGNDPGYSSNLKLHLTFDLADSLMHVVIDTTGTGNPSDTEYAWQDSISGKYIDWISGDHDTLTASEEWRTYANWGGANGDTVKVDIGKKYTWRAKARSGKP